VSTKPRSVSYKSLKVHSGGMLDRTVKPDMRLRFSDLLRLRGATVDSSRGDKKNASQLLDQVLFLTETAEEDRQVEDLLEPVAAPIIDETALAEEVVEPELEQPQTEESIDSELLSDVQPVADSPIQVEMSQKATAVSAVDELREVNVARYIAQTVSRFCNDAAVKNDEGWQVRITLRPDILNLTTMNLSLSPHWLLIRFDIRDTQARGLVVRHQKSLETMLDESVVPRREVSITFD
jgi:hypothetical protein